MPLCCPLCCSTQRLNTKARGLLTYSPPEFQISDISDDSPTRDRILVEELALDHILLFVLKHCSDHLCMVFFQHFYGHFLFIYLTFIYPGKKNQLTANTTLPRGSVRNKYIYATVHTQITYTAIHGQNTRNYTEQEMKRRGAQCETELCDTHNVPACFQSSIMPFPRKQGAQEFMTPALQMSLQQDPVCGLQLCIQQSSSWLCSTSTVVSSSFVGQKPKTKT